MMATLIPFLIVSMFSPGPNIIMLTSSGARFGLRATVPHMLGVVLGVGLIGGISGLGIGALILTHPQLRLSLQILSALWILWMSYRLLVTKPNDKHAKADRPMTFTEAMLFQAINPKIWAIALAASSGYLPGNAPYNEALQMMISFSGVNFFICVFWTYAGTLLARLLRSENSWFVFRVIMAALLALSALLVFW